VDASIRYTVGTSDLLITLECRDRVRTQDVTWIEQLATKRVHIGADRTLAVSSSPFSEAALKAARLHGISTRLISEVSDEDLRARMHTLEVSVMTLDLSLQQMHLHYVETLARSPTLDPGAAQGWAQDCWTASIFRVGDAGHPASLDDLIKLAASSPTADPTGAGPVALPPHKIVAHGTDLLSPHLRDVPANSPPVSKNFVLTFEQERVFALTDMGARQPSAISITVAATRSTHTAPPARLAQYSAEGRLIARFAEHPVELRPSETWSVLSYPTPPASTQDGSDSAA